MTYDAMGERERVQTSERASDSLRTSNGQEVRIQFERHQWLGHLSKVQLEHSSDRVSAIRRQIHRAHCTIERARARASNRHGNPCTTSERASELAIIANQSSA